MLSKLNQKYLRVIKVIGGHGTPEEIIKAQNDLNKEIDRILFPWHKRLWEKIAQVLFSWRWWINLFRPKVKIYNRYMILKNENRKRNKKGT